MLWQYVPFGQQPHPLEGVALHRELTMSVRVVAGRGMISAHASPSKSVRGVTPGRGTTTATLELSIVSWWPDVHDIAKYVSTA